MAIVNWTQAGWKNRNGTQVWGDICRNRATAQMEVPTYGTDVSYREIPAERLSDVKREFNTPTPRGDRATR